MKSFIVRLAVCLALASGVITSSHVRAESTLAGPEFTDTPRVLWKRQFNTAADERPAGLATDPNGNIFLTGIQSVAWIAKLNPSADTLWWIRLLPTYGRSGNVVTADADGNAIVAGAGEARGDYESGGTYSTLKMVKYSPSGDLLWEREYPLNPNLTRHHSHLYEAPSSLTTDPSTDIIVGGNTARCSMGHIGQPPPCGATEAWVVKISASGDLLWWSFLFGEESHDYARAVASDAQGNVIVAGELAHYVKDIIDGQLAWSVPWVVKFSGDGLFQWSRVPDLPADTTRTAAGVAADLAGNIVIGGSQYTSSSNQPAGGWLIQYGPTGDHRWGHHLGNEPQGIAIDALGNTLIYGNTSGKQPSDVSDAWVAKRDQNGHLLWRRMLRSAGKDTASGVAADLEGNIIVTGSTNGSLAAPNGGGSDIWLAKLRP